MVYEMIFLAIHVPPGMNQYFDYQNLEKEMRYNFSTLCASIMLLRFYFVIRVWTKYTIYRNDHSERCCEIEGIEADSKFALKSLLKEKPIRVMLINFFGSALLMGVAVRNFEMPYYENPHFYPVDYNADEY
jgi:hypothetical protein